MKSPAQTKMKSSPHPHKLTKQVLPWIGLFGFINLNGLGSFSQMGDLCLNFKAALSTQIKQEGKKEEASLSIQFNVAYPNSSAYLSLSSSTIFLGYSHSLSSAHIVDSY